MKKYKLKEEVKKTLMLTLAVGIIVVLLATDTNCKNKAIESCINAGHKYSYCVEELS